MHRLLICLFASALTVFAVGQQQPVAKHAKGPTTTTSKPSTSAAGPALPSEETVNAFLRETWGYNSALSWRVVSIKPSKVRELSEVTVMVSTPQGQQSSKFFVAQDGQHAVVGDIIPFGAHPFAPMRKELERKVTGPSRGPATAPVTVVEFSDLQCPHCKAAQPMLDKLLSEDPNVRLVFQSFPLPAHDWAAKGAAYADCIGHRSNDAFWKFIQGVYDAQAEITAATADEKLPAIADAAGAKGSEIAVCASQNETVGRVQQSVALGQSLEITGTPALFVNGRRIANVGQISYEELKGLVDYASKSTN